MKKLYTKPSICRHRLKIESCLVVQSQLKKLPATGVSTYINETKIEGLEPGVIPGDYYTEDHQTLPGFIEGD